MVRLVNRPHNPADLNCCAVVAQRLRKRFLDTQGTSPMGVGASAAENERWRITSSLSSSNHGCREKREPPSSYGQFNSQARPSSTNAVFHAINTIVRLHGSPPTCTPACFPSLLYDEVCCKLYCKLDRWLYCKLYRNIFRDVSNCEVYCMIY